MKNFICDCPEGYIYPMGTRCLDCQKKHNVGRKKSTIRNRKIITLRLNRVPRTEVAREFGISPNRVSHIVRVYKKGYEI